MLKLDKNGKYLLACSYGPDSMALFHMLDVEGYDFDVAHVNYHFRNESNEEEESLRKYSELHNKKIYVLDNRQIISSNLEAEARKIRYDFFVSVTHLNHYDAVLVAHHADDQIETYLLQKQRKIHVFYYGIKEINEYKNVKIIRPLLNVYKEDLLNYCKENNVPYAIDSSNLEDDYMRNKVRHSYLDKMSREDKEEYLKLIRDENFTIKSLLNTLDKDKIHNVDYLLSLKSYRFDYAIYLIANEAQIFKISRPNLNEIRKILLSKKPNITTSLKGFKFVKEYDSCYFEKEEEDVDFRYVINEPCRLDTPYFYLDFLGDTKNRNVYHDDYPLIIRNARNDDEVEIKDYTKKINRLFIDWKMPLSLRKRWPLIINNKGKVIYIPRYQKDFVKEDNCNFYVK